MIEITKNWFYKFSDLDLKWKKVKIADNLKVAIYDDLESKEKIIIKIWENSRLDYFSFFDKQWVHNKHFILKKGNTEVSVKSLIFSTNNDIIESQIIWELDASNTEINLDILSFVGEKWNIKLDWILQINKNLKKVKWRLDENNIFLWDKWKISGIPTLYVATNDIEAGHSCKMERISDDKLFYLRSRWIWKLNALQIMIESKIKNLFSDLEDYGKDFYEHIMEEILEKIK